MIPHLRRVQGPVDLLALHQAQPTRYPCLLESVVHGPPQARYDILFAFPGEALRLDAGLKLCGGPARGDDFLAAFDHWWQALRSPASSNCPLPFHGGWFLFLGYELAAQVEPVLRLPLAEHSPLPVACAVRAPAALIHDHHEQAYWLVAEPGCEDLLEVMAADVADSASFLPDTMVSLVDIVREDDARPYLASVERIKQYILAGDVFQVNLSRAWRGVLEAEGVHPAAYGDGALYRRLRAVNPAPFAGLCAMDDWAVISSSPERLVALRGGRVETRPIAGTAPRTVDDAALEQRLMCHPKERAEHIMLIDLERNDLGRVCVPGTVEVNELLALESYAYVHHLVSNVRGIKRPEVTPGEVIRAVFPGGTITGCPKVRCMEIIAELEGEARGAYTGALGYVNRDGSMDLNILIRTMVREGRQLCLRAGAGIVADSIPARELEETRAKARGMLAALAGDEYE